MLTCEVTNSKYGWALEWSDGTRSYMPDEATARRCAAAGEMEKALREMFEFMDRPSSVADGTWKEEAARIGRARAALSLALNAAI